MTMLAVSLRLLQRTSARALAGCGFTLAMLHVGAAAEPTPPPAASALATPSLWRMPGNAASMRIAGEDGSVTWPVYVPANSTARLNHFQLVFRTAASVMPEASWLTLTVNGQALDRAPIAAPRSVKALTFDIPPGALAAGWNAVEVSVVQRHRVDCSLDATYELWTQIDPARTGFGGAPADITTIDDLPAVPVDSTGVHRMHLVLPANPSPNDIERTLAIAERVALRGRFAHPVIDSSSTPAGLQIALAASPVAGAAPGVRIVAGATGAPTLVASGAAGDLDEIFSADAKQPKGTPEGLRALADASGVRFQPGQSRTLAELGVKTHTFSGRLFHASFDLILPPDAYLADYGEALLSVDGGYAAGLTSKARLIVRVNGIVDGNLALDRAGGAILKDEVIHMALEPFRPGRNHIDIEAQLPAAIDETCNPLAAINASERFLILGGSTISIPDLAHVARFPDLAASFTSGFRVLQNISPKLYLPHPTPATIAAAETLLANVAVRAGAPTGATVLQGQPQRGGDGAAIVFATATDLSPRLLKTVGVDAASVAGLWGAAREPDDVTGALDSPEAPKTSDRERLTAWGGRVSGLQAWYSSLFDGVASAAARSLRATGIVSFDDPAYSVTPDTSLLVAQGMLGGTALTLFAAPNDAAMTNGVTAITDLPQLVKIAGRAAAVDSAGLGLDLVASREPTFFRTEPFGLSNDRLIVAGWLSNHAGWYIGVAMAFAAFLGGSTWAALLLIRRGAR
jgi:hypothetical protein